MTSGKWASSTWQRPPNWDVLVVAVHRRSDWKCEVWSKSRNRKCGRFADGGVDHITRRADGGGDDSLENLQDTCWWHHQNKTQGEAQAALRAKRAARYRTPEGHPGGR